jgi:hypothetical protein
MKKCPTCKGVVSPAFELWKDNVIDLKPWEAYEFPWGSAVKKRNGKWTHIFICDQEINVENIEVILHENGIEFIKS